MNLSSLNREKILLIGAAVVIGLLILDRLVVTPLADGWSSRASRIAQLRIEITKGEALIDQESRWQRWQNDLALRLLPERPADAESLLLNQIDSSARQTGLILTALRPRWIEDKSGAPRLELHVAGSGSMAQLTTFLHQVETVPMAVAVEQLAISPSRSGSAQLGLELRLIALPKTIDKGGR